MPIEKDIDLYAAVTIAIQLMPGAQDTVLALCGIDPSQYADISSSWQQKLGASQDLRATFAMHSGEHRAALRQLMAGARGFIPT